MTEEEKEQVWIRIAAEEEERSFYAGRASPEWLEALGPLGTGDAVNLELPLRAADQATVDLCVIHRREDDSPLLLEFLQEARALGAQATPGGPRTSRPSSRRKRR